ncbi:AI-2E family transporter [Natrinema salifodinae]|uniref:Predicted PurR-regulated permease PerM n=1 Tax=Natrinema salifodinae TaxID=1202768 RepID=A0A1I0Q3Z7_9EURY|nr:AI-2E family transporter [Natrinema salifodinae]SEW21515.1 Predicted PurR-regulated permease PerM [Natrinema salifodinae]
MNLSKGFLLVLVALFVYLSLLLVLPFFQYVLGAILLAYVLYPAQKRLENRISPSISAFGLVGLAVAGFVVPLLAIGVAVASDARRLLERVNTDDLQLIELERAIEEQTGQSVDLPSALADAAQSAGTVVLERSTEWFSTITHTLIGLGLAIFLLYYLLKDGSDLLAWLRELTPLPDDAQDDFYRKLDEVMWAVLAGHVLIAIIQGTIAGLGLLATGIPNAAFWTFVMIILSLIPLIGSFLIWGPAVGYLFLTGEPLLAAALFAYSAVVVGLSDDYLRPILVDRYAELNPAVIILGVLGGVYAFGVMGLFYGPVVLGALIATLSVMNDHYDRLEDTPGMQ